MTELQQRSRPTNAVARAKFEAIEDWDRWATAEINKGHYIRGFGAWTAKQLAKAAPESWPELALDVASLGSGGLASKGGRLIAGRLGARPGASVLFKAARFWGTPEASYFVRSPMKAQKLIRSAAREADRERTEAQSLPRSTPAYYETHPTLGRPKLNVPTVPLASQLREPSKKPAVRHLRDAPRSVTQMYFALPDDVRAQVNAESDRILEQRTGVASKLSLKPKDSALRQQWWGIANEVMMARAEADRFHQPPISKNLEHEIMQKGVYVPGVWGMEIPGKRSRPGFDINKIQQPKLSPSAEQEIMSKGIYVPGVWGMEIRRSRPAPGRPRAGTSPLPRSRPVTNIDSYLAQMRAMIKAGPVR